MTQQAQDVVLQMSRRFDAPRERVFDAWTNPDVLLDWWRAGPTGRPRPPRSISGREAAIGWQ